MEPALSTSRIPWTAASAVMPPPTIRYFQFGMVISSCAFPAPTAYAAHNVPPTRERLAPIKRDREAPVGYRLGLGPMVSWRDMARRSCSTGRSSRRTVVTCTGPATPSRAIASRTAVMASSRALFRSFVSAQTVIDHFSPPGTRSFNNTSGAGALSTEGHDAHARCSVDRTCSTSQSGATEVKNVVDRLGLSVLFSMTFPKMELLGMKM